MKKLLLIAAILGICTAATAQSFTFGFQDRTLNAGDTIQFPFDNSDVQVDFKFTNTSDADITLQVTVNTISAEGFDVYGVCAGDCAPGNVSPEFTIASGQTYTGCDARIECSRTAEDGLFTVTAANVNDPDDQITVYLHLYRPLAIHTAQSATLTTYPNPATDNLNINYLLPDNTTKGQILMTNMLGAVVRTISIDNNQGTTTLNLNSLPAGVYNLTVQAANKNMGSTKVVVR